MEDSLDQSVHRPHLKSIIACDAWLCLIARQLGQCIASGNMDVPQLHVELHKGKFVGTA